MHARYTFHVVFDLIKEENVVRAHVKYINYEFRTLIIAFSRIMLL
jgi:hypothetical protein